MQDVKQGHIFAIRPINRWRTFWNKGYFYRPTIIKNVSPKMCIAQEEVFGPVAPIIIDDSNGYGMEWAIKLANNTQYGLGASIFNSRNEKAERLSRLVSSGIVSVNNVVASDPGVTIWWCKEKVGLGRVVQDTVCLSLLISNQSDFTMN